MSYDPYQQQPQPGYTPPPSDGTWPAPGDPYQQPTYPPTVPAQPGYTQPAFPSTEPASGYPPPAYGAASGQGSGTGAWTPPPPPSPWSTPTPAKRGVGVGLLIGAIIATAAVCGTAGYFTGKATSGSSSSAGKSSTETGPRVTQSAAPAQPAIALGDGAGLKAHLVPPPAGAKTYPVDDSTNGVMTIDQFVKAAFDGDADERARLVQRGFEVAAENDWSKSSVEYSTQLIQFSAPAGAEGYVTGQHSAFLDDTDVKANYTIPGVTLGYGFEKPAFDSLGNRRAILICQAKNIVIVLFVYTPGQFDRNAEAAVLSAQLTALG
jgi:hypothetical protein